MRTATLNISKANTTKYNIETLFNIRQDIDTQSIVRRSLVTYLGILLSEIRALDVHSASKGHLHSHIQ